ncbi:uncharacterized protein LOC8282527 isoform X2 [Ricinus communis]|uniref:uncharacterized protein LOC8282527 isoform X2 n=1 Tax=Ricinus communis TaxID=3988 RepID=UPI00201AF31A|nr:uncharacterized protein LOC8282527 isoform X2 [Ricinus communis]
MREGLRSSGKLLVEAEKGEASPATLEVNSTKEKGCYLSDEKAPNLIGSGIEEEKVASTSKEKAVGLKHEECGIGSDIGEDKIAECSSNKKKRSIIVGEGESEDDHCVKKLKSREDDMVDGRPQVVRRVLRSMSAAKCEGNVHNEKGQINGGFIAERTIGKTGSEEERIKEEKEKTDNLHYSCQSDDMVNTKLEHKRGQPPKFQESDEYEKKLADIQKGEIDQSAGRGSYHLKNKLSNRIKRKRGRPRKSQESDEFQGTWGDVEKGEIDQSAGHESHHLNKKLSNEIKRKRGRPPKSQESNEFQQKWGDVEKGEVDQYAGLHNKSSNEKKCKRGRPPKSQESDVFQQKCDDVEKGEIDQSAGQESHQFNNKVSKKIKRKRGRPPKAQQSDGSEKKWGGVEKEVIDLSIGQQSRAPNNEAINFLKPRRGRPSRAKKSDLSEKKRADPEEEACDRVADEKSDQLDNEVRENLKHNLERPFKLNKAKKVGALRKKKMGRPSKDNIHDVNHNIRRNSSLSGKRLLVKENNTKLFPGKKIKDNSEENVGNTKQKAGEITHSRSERQAVRDKIVDMLLGAGWEIQHRPRNGRQYMDAVYVNPEGRTHWSVTLAYRVLKKHYEDGNGGSKMHNSSFQFTPIPEEELSILTKVMIKERSDKNKKKKKWNKGEKGDKTAGAVNKKKWKLQKRKLGAWAGVSHKMLKGRKKLKNRHCQQDDLAATLGEGSTVSVRGHKRLETHGRKRCSLIARKSQDGIESDKDGYVLYNGKRTVLAWMIDLGTVPLDGKVQYLKRRKARFITKGSITTDGIQCDCCNKTFTSAEFEAHAGGKSCQPFENIYLETGSSLLQCQLDSWYKEDDSAHKGFHFIDIDGEDPNDDTCGICGDGGDLICCDSCPSTFHQSCLEIRFPSGLWHCMYCLCKFCGMVGGNTCQRDGNMAAVSHALVTCHLCEDKYHHSCFQEKDIINADPGSPSFCGNNCQELYERLQMLFGVKQELEAGFSWTFVRRFDVSSDISVSGMSRKVDCNSKVAVALQIMDECFVPMVDHKSGVNLIRNIVYSFGSNFNRLNYSGFFNAVLERGDEMIAAASIRIHGNHLAEMPFIGTRYMYRRQGMCRRLLSAIEMGLCSLNVGKLVIPAISELTGTWTSVFGFKHLEGSDKQIMRNMNMMVFPGVDMLQKPLLKHPFTEENMHPIEGLNSTKREEFHTKEEMTKFFNENCSAGCDLKGSSESDVTHSGNIMNEHAAVESSSVLDGCLNDISDITAQNASDKIPVDQSKGILNPHDSLCDARDQTGDEMLNNSDKRCSNEVNLEASSQAGVPCASNIVSQPAAAGSGLPHPDGCSDETTDITNQNVLDKKCNDYSTLISKNVEHTPDSLVHNTAEIISSHSQELVSDHGRKVTDQNADLADESGSVVDGCPNYTSDSTTQGAIDKIPDDRSGVISNHLGVRNRMVNPPDSLCDARAQPGYEMLNGSDKRCSNELDLKASGETGVPHASNIIGKPATAGSALQHPDGTNETTDITIQDVIQKKCYDHLSPISENERDLDPLVHNTTEIISFHSQELVCEHGAKVSYSYVADSVSETTNISNNVFQSTLPEAPENVQDSLDGCFAALPIEQNMSSMGNDAHCISLEVGIGVGGEHDLKDASNTAQKGTILLHGGLDSDRTHVNTELLKPPGSDFEIDVIQRNSESTCSSSSAPSVILHCASGGGNSCGAPEVVILSNQAN